MEYENHTSTPVSNTTNGFKVDRGHKLNLCFTGRAMELG